MPTVPFYDSQFGLDAPSAGFSAPSGVRFRQQDAGGSIARGLTDIGQALGAHFQRQQALKDNIDADQGIATLSKLALEVETGALSTKRGASEGSLKSALAAFDEGSGSVLAGKTQRAQAAIERQRATLRLSIGRKIAAHEMQEMEAHELDTATAFIEGQRGLYSQLAISPDGPDPMEEGLVVGMAEERIRALVESRGGDKTQAATAVAKWKGDAAMSRLEALSASRDFDMTVVFGESRKDWIAEGGGDIEKAEKLVADARAELTARNVVNGEGTLEEKLKKAEALADPLAREIASGRLMQGERNRKLVIDARDMGISESLRVKMHGARQGSKPKLSAEEFAYLGPARAREWEERAEWAASGGTGFYDRNSRRAYERTLTALHDTTERQRLANLTYEEFDSTVLRHMPEESSRGNLRDKVLKEWLLLKEAASGATGGAAKPDLFKPTRPLATSANQSFRKAAGAPLQGEVSDDEAEVISRMWEFLESMERDYYRETGKNPPAEERQRMIADVVMEHVRDDTWVNEHSRIQDIGEQMEDLASASLDESQVTDSERHRISPNLRRFARSVGAELSDSQIRQVLALRRIILAPRATQEQAMNASYLIREIMGAGEGDALAERLRDALVVRF